MNAVLLDEATNCVITGGSQNFGNDSGLICFWNLNYNTLIRSIKLDSYISYIVRSRNAASFYTSEGNYGNGGVSEYDIKSGQKLFSAKIDATVNFVTESWDGEQVLCTSGNHGHYTGNGPNTSNHDNIYIINKLTSHIKKIEVKGMRSYVSGGFLRNGQIVLAEGGMRGGSMYILDGQTGEVLAKNDLFQLAVLDIAISSDERFVATSAEGHPGDVVVRNAKLSRWPTPPLVLEEKKGPQSTRISCVRFLHNTNYLVAGGQTSSVNFGRIRIWEFPTGKVIDTYDIQGKYKDVKFIDVAANGKNAAVLCEDESISIFDIK